MYAYILRGEVAGTAAGFIVSGTVASVISWRVAFVVLALPGFALARTLWRTVPEPQRGGQSQLDPGVLDLNEAIAAARARADTPAGDADPAPSDELARERVKQRGIGPDPALLLTKDAQKMGLLEATRYTLRIPTNAILIISSALGYFFFAGLQTFALLFVRGHYQANQATAGCSAGCPN